MKPGSKLLAEFCANIEELGRIADDIQAAADDTREFLRRHREMKDHPIPLSRPEARVFYNYCPPLKLKGVD